MNSAKIWGSTAQGAPVRCPAVNTTFDEVGPAWATLGADVDVGPAIQAISDSVDSWQ